MVHFSGNMKGQGNFLFLVLSIAMFSGLDLFSRKWLVSSQTGTDSFSANFQCNTFHLSNIPNMLPVNVDTGEHSGSWVKMSSQGDKGEI